jgi:hypothetical protein
MCKNLDSPNPFSQTWEKGNQNYISPLPSYGRGAGGEGKDLILHSDAPLQKSEE